LTGIGIPDLAAAYHTPCHVEACTLHPGPSGLVQTRRSYFAGTTGSTWPCMQQARGIPIAWNSDAGARGPVCLLVILILNQTWAVRSCRTPQLARWPVPPFPPRPRMAGLWTLSPGHWWSGQERATNSSTKLATHIVHDFPYQHSLKSAAHHVPCVFQVSGSHPTWRMIALAQMILCGLHSRRDPGYASPQCTDHPATLALFSMISPVKKSSRFARGKTLLRCSHGWISVGRGTPLAYASSFNATLIFPEVPTPRFGRWVQFALRPYMS